MKPIFWVKTIVVCCLMVPVYSCAQQQPQRHDSLPIKADTITFASNNLQLKGLLWRPEGKGPFPAILFNHGSEDNSLRWAHRLAGVFVQKGYAFFIPFRRGQTLSAGQGRYILSVVDSAAKVAAGPLNDTVSARKARSALAIQLHQTEQLQDQLAGLKALLQQPGIDKSRMAVAGISFGGIQTILLAAEKTPVKCGISFAGAAMMWNGSTDVQEWMKGIATKAQIPVMFVQAENDFSIEPSIQMAAVMKENELPYELKIYPANGTTHAQGHSFVLTSKVWMPDVFAFLDKYLK